MNSFDLALQALDECGPEGKGINEHGVKALRVCKAADDLLDAAKHAAMEWRLHGQLTDSCRVLEAAISKAEGRQGK